MTTHRGVAVLVSVDASPHVVRRLAELGLRPGVALRPLRRTAGGGRILAVGDARVAVDRATWRRLVLAPAEVVP